MEPSNSPPRPETSGHDQKFTVLVVPERGARVSRFTLTGWHVLLLQQVSRVPLNTLRVRIVAAGALAIIAGMVGMTWQYLSLVGRVHEDTAVREENLELKARLATMQEKIDHVNEVLGRSKHLYANLQNVAQLSDPERRLALADEESVEEDPRQAIDPQRLSDRIDQLQVEAQRQEESLQALTGYFEDRKALLASAPAIWPVRGWVTSDFGYRLDPYTSQRKAHVGLDIANSPGTQVVAPAMGTVVYAAAENGYGNVIVIDHGFGLKTRYGHLAKINVRLGDRVQRGQPIGAIGNTGRSTGPHLHYEVRVDGVPENPRKFILETPEPDDPAQRGAKATADKGFHGGMGGGD